jgi:glutathione synthase/RimK-type ligase-like ATP-grasp enzyme
MHQAGDTGAPLRLSKRDASRRYTGAVSHVSPSGSTPRVLIVSTELWLSTARLSLVLASLGCEVGLLAPANHPAMVTDAITTFCRHNPLRPLPVLRKSLLELRPDALIPADERTVIHLQELWQEAEARRDEDDRFLLMLLEKSFGSREALFAARSRMHVLQVALEEGAAIPDTVCVEREQDLEAAVERLGLPLVLKADMTSGGDGVAIAADLEDARRSWRKLHDPPNVLRAVRRGVLFKNWGHLRSWAKRESLAITAQRFVAGSERTSMAVCHEGEVVASVCLEVARTWQVRGPSSVLRVVDDPAMRFAMERVAKRLRLSGFCGFDFMVPQGSEQALLIEMNPRPTQTSHLALGARHDLVAGYVRSMLGLEVGDREAVCDGELIALFPQELVRDAQSEFVREGYLDVPWESPRLVERALRPLPKVITEDARWRGV